METQVTLDHPPGAETPARGRPRLRITVFACWMVALALLFLPQGIALMRYAWSRDLHSHIPLVPLVTAYLIFLKRDALGPPVAGSAGIGSLVAAAGGALWVWLRLAGPADLGTNDSLALEAAAFLLLLWGGALAILGAGWLRPIAFPVAFLIFLVPLPDAAAASLEDGLTVASAEVSHWLFTLSGTPVFRDGQMLQIPGIALHVARECSGIRSTWVLAITSSIAAYLFLDSPWRRAALVAFVIPLGILRNAIRILTIGLLCVHIGPHMIDSAIHRQGGPLFFAVSLVPLFGLAWWLRRREVRAAS